VLERKNEDSQPSVKELEEGMNSGWTLDKLNCGHKTVSGCNSSRGARMPGQKK